jgi:hypothetical protein
MSNNINPFPGFFTNRGTLKKNKFNSANWRNDPVGLTTATTPVLINGDTTSTIFNVETLSKVYATQQNENLKRRRVMKHPVNPSRLIHVDRDLYELPPLLHAKFYPNRRRKAKILDFRGKTRSDIILEKILYAGPGDILILGDTSNQLHLGYGILPPNRTGDLVMIDENGDQIQINSTSNPNRMSKVTKPFTSKYDYTNVITRLESDPDFNYYVGGRQLLSELLKIKRRVASKRKAKTNNINNRRPKKAKTNNA